MAKKTFENDDNLPALPLPSLKNTLDLYLQSVVPFLTTNELEKTKRIVEEFGDNEGQILQEKLLQRANENKNWVNSTFKILFQKSLQKILTKIPSKIPFKKSLQKIPSKNPFQNPFKNHIYFYDMEIPLGIFESFVQNSPTILRTISILFENV